MDSLHRNFPDILYSDRFRTDPLVNYIRQQAHANFNQFTHEHTLHNQPQILPVNTVIATATTTAEAEAVTATAEAVTATATATATATTTDTSGAATEATTAINPITPTRNTIDVIHTLMNIAAPRRQRRQYITNSIFGNMAFSDEYIYYDTTHANHGDLFNSILNLMGGPMEDVIVSPSNDQVAASTDTYLTPTALEENCAICQEEIETSVEVRKIHACDHIFHRPCIDRWFEQSVFCPICRVDIREPDLTEAP